MLPPKTDETTSQTENDIQCNKSVFYFLAEVGSIRTNEHRHFRTMLTFLICFKL